MTQEKADKIFATDLGQQLDVIYVTPDDTPFIRHEEAVKYLKHVNWEGLQVFNGPVISEWYPSEPGEEEGVTYSIGKW